MRADVLKRQTICLYAKVLLMLERERGKCFGRPIRNKNQSVEESFTAIAQGLSYSKLKGLNDLLVKTCAYR